MKISEMNIEIVENGYVLKKVESGDDYKEDSFIFKTKDELINEIQGVLTTHEMK